MTKRGRPTSEPKQHVKIVKMSNNDLEMLDFCCNELSSNISEVLRNGLKMMYASVKK